MYQNPQQKAYATILCSEKEIMFVGAIIVGLLHRAFTYEG